MDFGFTVCDQAAGEVCPVWPGRPVTAHWGIHDPAAADGSEARAHTRIPRCVPRPEQRIKIFISLPIDKLDRIALTKQVEAIGRIRPDATEDRAS
jgi:arsenate reductase